jgi:hypothetical protein
MLKLNESVWLSQLESPTEVKMKDREDNERKVKRSLFTYYYPFQSAPGIISGTQVPRCGPLEMHGPDELNHLGTKIYLRRVGFGSFLIF